MVELRAQNLSKRYGRRHVVRDVSLKVRSEQIVGLLGPNGAGKSVSFYMLAGLIAADAGNIWMDDEPIDSLHLSSRVRHGIGYMPQQSSIFRGLTAEQNILGVLELRVGLSRQQQKEEMERLIVQLGLQNCRTTLGSSLSGGEARRVEFARLLACAPTILLLDEPYAGVDPITISQINEMIQRMRQDGLGILITDHNVRDTVAVCDYVYILIQGAIAAEGSASEVLEHPLVRQHYLGEDFK